MSAHRRTELAAQVQWWLYRRLLIEAPNVGWVYVARTRKVDRVVSSMLHGNPQDRDRNQNHRLREFFRYGLQQRLGERLNDREKRIFAAYRQLGFDEWRLSVCRACGQVFERARKDKTRCDACKNVRPLRLPSKKWWWIRMNPATGELEYEGECLGCQRPYWAGRYSQGFCDGCGSVAARQRRWRKRVQ